MKRLPVLLLALLLLAGCAPAEETGEYSLYFRPASYVAGPALTALPFTPDPDRPAEEALINALLAGPGDSGLVTPFPAGVSLRSWYLKDGLLSVNLSEQYGSLSGMALTMADYSMTLTLCQLPWVEGVSITVENDPIHFRYRQILSPEDVLLSDLPAEAGP